MSRTHRVAGAYDIPVSATTRRLALRMRPDLVVQPQQIGRRRYWAVKDPLALNYFHLRDEEHAILEMLDGRTSLGEIKRRFERVFAPLQITVEQIQAFLGRLYESGLLVAEAPDQGEQLLLRRRRQRTRTMLQSLTGILAIRLLSFDAEPILHRLVPLCRWMFSPWLLAGCTLLVLGAGTLVAVEFAAMQADLPAFEAFFGAGNLVWLAVALA
jgi:putative peptide zinc metalloprotease protein